ncbi:MAG: TIGR02679 family protein [Candidatus Sericytochromatia bacterium]|nr:TIGR02679 family protein [Candidatus Tanganyikabacteria bacterium]
MSNQEPLGARDTPLGAPGLDRLLSRLAARLARGKPLAGRLSLEAPTEAEREAIGRLLGRRAVGQGSLSIDLGEVERLLAEGGRHRTLAEAVEAVHGPVAAPAALARERAAEVERAWAAAYEEARSSLASKGHDHVAWIEDLVRSGAAKRLARRDAGVGAALLRQAVATAARLPVDGVPLASLAASATGDSHALDRGSAVGLLVFRLVARLAGPVDSRGIEAWRESWDRVGVVCDELSAPVLVLGLSAEPDHPVAEALNLFAKAGEPHRLSIRSLLRFPFRFKTLPGTERTAYVCENPSIVAAVADRLGNRCPPLICVEGQPKAASRLLLQALTSQGWALLYHGDFDWKGIEIANFVLNRHGARPWCMTAADYRKAPPGVPLSGKPVQASWDSELESAMVRSGHAVHEEAVLESLLGDLASRPPTWSLLTDHDRGTVGE